MTLYLRSKIYTIRAPETDKYYIGSTTQLLNKRFNGHCRSYKFYKKGKGTYVTSFQILELEGAYIELLETYPCKSKEQLLRREGKLIREHENNCVNKCIAGRTWKERYEAEHAEKINCECGVSVCRATFKRHRTTKKHQKLMDAKNE